NTDGTLAEHIFKVKITDACANVGSQEIPFQVKDCKAPTAYCIFGLSADMLPTGEVELWASDFNAGSFDNCTDMENLRLTFADPAVYPDSTSRTFLCSDGEIGTVEVELWAQDVAGNRSFCTTFVNIQASSGGFPCVGANNNFIGGRIATEMGEGIRGVNILVSGQDSTQMQSDEGGMYFVNNAQTGHDYTFTPVLDEHPLNGVTTYDLVLMTRHILGTQHLDSPYKMIAADVNNSGTITTFDVVQVRKLILNIYDAFPNNTAWRFVPWNYDFQQPDYPFEELYPEFLNINNLSETRLNLNFVGIKIGDVNGSAVVQP
ncbi:MAG: dockerin type I domain-containing protein, partial [Bacteroidota bacterium]